MTALVTTKAGLAGARDALTGSVAVVLTMGALHEGHRELMRAARASADHVLVTIFVNPLQFGPNEDFDRYPRTLDADLEICRAEGVDLVFAPERAEMYPDGNPGVLVLLATFAGAVGLTLRHTLAAMVLVLGWFVVLPPLVDSPLVEHPWVAGLSVLTFLRRDA